jgi:hypothetical protein
MMSPNQAYPRFLLSPSFRSSQSVCTAAEAVPALGRERSLAVRPVPLCPSQKVSQSALVDHLNEFPQTLDVADVGPNTRPDNPASNCS